MKRDLPQILRIKYAVDSTDIIKVTKSSRIRLAKHTARMGAMRNSYKILIWKPEWNGLLGRPRHR
jgi:hypothetical protein